MPNQTQTQSRAKSERNHGERAMFISNIRAVEKEDGSKTYRLSFSSEEPYKRWWGVEVLSHDEASVDLTRLNSIGCLLFNHDTNRVIGKITKAWIENNRGEAEVEFDNDEFSQMIHDKVDSGTLKGVSVGYVVSDWEEVAAGETSMNGRFTGECSIATKWLPLEVSIVSVPADATVGVGRSAEDDTDHNVAETKGASSFLYEKQLQINLNTIRR